MAEAEEGPLRLYHPWSAHLIAVQTDGCAKSPVTKGFEPNLGPVYVPFHIIDQDGCTILAKYVKVKMTNDPYAYGMINGKGEVFKGLIHAAPVLDITYVPRVTILPHAPQKHLQNDNTAKADDLKRHARDIARDSHRIEDKIRAMVSSYMAPKDDEDPELVIGRLVC